MERKTAVDFITSIMDRRIFSQVPLLKATYRNPTVLVEGDLFRTRSAIEPTALHGALSWLAVIEGVRVVHTANDAHTADMLLTMQRHALEGLGYEIALRAAKPKDRTSQVEYLLCGLPAVGPVAARKLMSHFGSPHAVFGASVEELRTCAGIGPKTAIAIREVLDFDARP